MKSSGVIVAALDPYPEAIEAWNRWYDLDHLPPNVALPGIMSGRRYVATPRLNAVRTGEADSWWADRQSSFLTIYTLCGDVLETFGEMVKLRVELEEAARMFAEDLKVVRGGDALTLQRATGRSGLTNEASELAFLGHAGVVMLRNRDAGSFSEGDHETLGAALLSADVGSALLSYRSAVVPAAGLHVLLLEDEVATRAKAVAGALRKAAHGRFSQAAYEAIEPHAYPWADGLRAAGLPRI